MKKLLAALFTLSTLGVFAQTHAGINYQSIIRNTGGTAMASTPVTIDFKLYSTVPTFTNTLLYHETHSTTTNQFGMANLVIGKGAVVGGVFSFTNVPWPAGVAYEVYVNSNMVGTRQPFMSVPYAFAAAYAPAPSVTYSSNILSVGGNTVSIPAGTTYSAGPGIDISASGVISNTAVTAGNPTIIGAGAATVLSSGNSYTVDVPVVTPVNPSITGSGITTVSSSGNSYTVNTPAPLIYTSGPGVNISAGGIITATGSISGAGAATVTGVYPNYTVNVPTGTTLPTGFNGQFLYNTGGTVWDTLPRNNLYFDGTNFGVGTTFPSANFHVNGDAKFNVSVTTPQLYITNFKMNGSNPGYVLTSDASGNGT
ncbi:MAG: hypothetical protein V4580_02945, partial [Bacteroidota bacterium]